MWLLLAECGRAQLSAAGCSRVDHALHPHPHFQHPFNFIQEVTGSVRFVSVPDFSTIIGSDRKMSFPGSTRFGLRFSDASWLGSVRFASAGSVSCSFLFIQKCTSKGIGRQGMVLKDGDSLQADSSSIYLSTYLSLSLYICIYIYSVIYTHICVYICIYIYIYLSISLSLYIYIYRERERERERERCPGGRKVRPQGPGLPHRQPAPPIYIYIYIYTCIMSNCHYLM